LHFRLFVLLFLSFSTVGYSNVDAKSLIIKHSGYINSDTIPLADTLSKSDTALKSKQFIEDPIFSNGEDSMIYSLDGKKVYLYKNATVNYKNIELKAQYIEFNMEKKEVFANGLPDSTGKIVGRPVFKEGSQSYEMDNIFYNFDTKRAKISGVVSEQAGGYMHAKIVKKMENNVSNIAGGKFTTCDQPHPHYYIAITKGKVIPNDKIISGPAYLVIEDVPFPLILPFGFFPNSKSRASGVIIPEYGEEVNRGVFLRGGGFYFGLSDFIDLKLTGDIYSFGSWAIHTQSMYKKRYSYSGSFGFDYSKNKLPTDSSSSYSIRWNHSQDPKASPNSTFSANVNFQSTNNNRYNARSIDNFLQNQINSSISYSRVFVGTPFNLNTSLTHSQNNRTKQINLTFPRVSFSMSRIYPFKRKSNIGAPAWYEKIGVSLSSSLDNSVSVLEDNLFKKSVVDSMKNGMKHDIPISTSFNLFKHINVSPSVGYSEFWYMKTIDKQWNQDSARVEIDTISGFKRAWQYSTSVSMGTKIYGMFNFGSNKAIQAIRHVLSPSLSVSYRPDFSEPQYGYYKTVQNNINGNTSKYSIFEQSLYGGPSAGKSGSIGFTLGNNLEMKVRSSKDTVNNFKKIKIFESLNFSSSYNLLADSMNLSDISVSGYTRLFEKVNINFSGVFSPYAINSAGQRINQFEINASNKLARFTSGSIGFDFSLNSSKKIDGKKSQIPLPGDNPLAEEAKFGQSLGTNYGSMQYVDFDIPWNLRINYNYSYSKPGIVKNISQTLSFSGDFSLTPKWKIGFTSGYDFKSQKLTTTSLNIYRDLHCWEMRLTVIPIGSYKSYSFQINVKSGMLQDLKYHKRDSYLDNL